MKIGRSQRWLAAKGSKGGKAVRAASLYLNDRYRIIKSLQTTGALKLYLAQDCYRPNRVPCLVKHLDGSAIDPSEQNNMRLRLREEAEILDRLGYHAQIPQLLAFFEQETDSYFIEEYVSGTALTQEMMQGCRWATGQVIQLFQSVLPVLEFIHSRQVIHRHLQPDSLLRRQDGSVTLIGFGSLQPGRSLSQRMEASIWIAPEQACGNPGMSSDLYALGMIGIQALTGQNPAHLKRDRVTGEICWKGEATVTQELAEVIDRMVAYHFRDRYQSATEVLTAIRSFAQQASVPIFQSLLTSTAYPTPSVVSFPVQTIPPSTLQSEGEELTSFSWATQIPNFNHNIASPRRSKKWMFTGTAAGLFSAMTLTPLIQNADRLVAIAPTSEAPPDATPTSNQTDPIPGLRLTPPILRANSTRLPAPVPPAQMNAAVRTTAPVESPAVSPVSAVSQEPPRVETTVTEEPDRPLEPAPVAVEVPSIDPPPVETATVAIQPLYYHVMNILKGTPAELIPRLTQLSTAYQAKGDLEAAIFFYERVIENQALVYGEQHPDLIFSLSHLAKLYQESGNVQAVIPLHEQALALWQALNPEDYPDLANRLEQMGELRRQIDTTAIAQHSDEMNLDLAEPSNMSDVAVTPNPLTVKPPVEKEVAPESVEPEIVQLELLPESVESEPLTLPQTIPDEVTPPVDEASVLVEVSDFNNPSSLKG